MFDSYSAAPGLGLGLDAITLLMLCEMLAFYSPCTAMQCLGCLSI